MTTAAPMFRSVCQLTGDLAGRPTKYFALLDSLTIADREAEDRGLDERPTGVELVDALVERDRLLRQVDELRGSRDGWIELAGRLADRIDALTAELERARAATQPVEAAL